MNKLFTFVKTKFLTKSFLSFCIIGVINTLINSLVMKGSLYLFGLTTTKDISTSDAGTIYYLSMGISTLLAFLIASLFSYFANAIFTYNQKKRDKRTFFEAFFTFILRFVLTYLLTLLIWYLIITLFKIENDPSGWYRTLSNLIASILMIPPFYIVLGIVFKRTKDRVEEKETVEE